MTLQGKWRIVEMPDYEADFPDMMGPAFIQIGPTGGEFAFGCVTGAFGGCDDTHATALQFSWDGNNEIDEYPSGEGRGGVRR